MSFAGRKRRAEAEAGENHSSKNRRLVNYNQYVSPLLMECTLESILNFLSEYDEIEACSLVCKRMRQVTTSDSVRKRVRFTKRYWGKVPNPLVIERHLTPFVDAGNLDATHFLGMALYYCKAEMRRGIQLLLQASDKGHLDSTYDAALIIRKQNQDDSKRMLTFAASRGHLPSRIELSSERISHVIAEHKLGPSAIYANQQKAPVYSFIREYWDARGRGSSRCWCSTGCGRHRLSSADRKKLLDRDPSCPRMILRKCARCFVAKYCSRLCQVVSWDNGHRNNCLPNLPFRNPLRMFLMFQANGVNNARAANFFANLAVVGDMERNNRLLLGEDLAVPSGSIRRQ
uniref:MYND-type domain-containing protein n=1 Tax=Lotharella oceanica TaxID=641309 RepID=A0A7S2U5X1_9EUKA